MTRSLRPSTSELFISPYHADARIPIEQLPGRILAAIATVGLGGSQGFESASAMIGGGLRPAPRARAPRDDLGARRGGFGSARRSRVGGTRALRLLDHVRAGS
ncbi:MAG: hypothetical protein FJ144_06085 [Deltaproteobacteria bacterium]|nr:hypothetical protein [Deltaproteobacteria bacterium]